MREQGSQRFPWRLFSWEGCGAAVLVLVGLSWVIGTFGAGSAMGQLLPSEGLRRRMAGLLFGGTGASIGTVLSLVLAFWGVLLPGRADVLLGTNGERFAGRVVDETPDAVVFDSELGGRLVIPRSRIQEIQRTAPPPEPVVPGPASIIPAPAPNAVASTNLAWRPPAVGLDGSDWIQLKSGEWLKGRLLYVQERKVEFDSDELKDQSLDLKDVRQIHPANPLFIKFDDRDQLYGMIAVSNEVVEVVGPEQLSLRVANSRASRREENGKSTSGRAS